MQKQKHNEKNFYLIPKRGRKYWMPALALSLGLSILGGQWLYLESKDKINDWMHPEIIPAAAAPAPTDPRSIICAATNGENCDVIYNLCMAESGKWLKSDQEKCSRWSVNENTNGTFDYSWLQINDVHIIGRAASKGKGTITMECVYDLPCVARWTNDQIKAGRGNIWAAWDKI